MNTTWKGRTMRRIRRSLSVMVALSLATLVAQEVMAYTILGPTFLPDHGARGARILVVQLPLRADCRAVEIWLAPGDAPSPPITSTADTRLIRLHGVVATRTGYGPSSTTTTPERSTVFSFRVPALTSGSYATFARCVGDGTGFATLWQGATTFTVDPGVAPDTSTASAPSTQPDPARADPSLLFVVAAVAGALACLRRSAPRRAA